MTLTLTSDDLESHIFVNVSSTLTNTTIWFVVALCFTVDVRTDGRTDGRTFLPVSLGRVRYRRSHDAHSTAADFVWLQRRRPQLVLVIPARPIAVRLLP